METFLVLSPLMGLFLSSWVVYLALFRAFKELFKRVNKKSPIKIK